MAGKNVLLLNTSQRIKAVLIPSSKVNIFCLKMTFGLVFLHVFYVRIGTDIKAWMQRSAH